MKYLYTILKIFKIINSNKYNQLFDEEINKDKFLDLFQELSKEYKIFQIFLELNIKIDKDMILEAYNYIEFNKFDINELFYKDNNEKLLTSQLAKLSLLLLDKKEIYIPSTIGIIYPKNYKFYIENNNLSEYFIAEAKKIIENFDITFHYSDPLENPTFIDDKASHKLKQFDGVFSLIPFNDNIDIKNDKFFRFILESKAVEVLYFEHILSQMKDKAVIIAPIGVTFRSNLVNLREYLIKNNLLEAILQLPPHSLNNLGLETSIFILNKNKSDNKVFFFDLTKYSERKSRKMVLKDDSIEKILKIYKDKQEFENISKIISNEEIIKQNYSLSVYKYLIPIEIQNSINIISKYPTKKLSDIALLKKSQMLKNDENGHLIYEIMPEHFSHSGYTIMARQRKIKGNYSNYKIEKNDILLTTKGTIGKVAIIGDIKGDFVASQACHIIRVENEKVAIFLYMFLKSKIAQSLLKQFTLGHFMPQITTNDLKELLIPFTNYLINKANINFYKEIEIYKQIDNLYKQIDNLHRDFVG